MEYCVVQPDKCCPSDQQSLGHVSRTGIVLIDNVRHNNDFIRFSIHNEKDTGPLVSV